MYVYVCICILINLNGLNASVKIKKIASLDKVRDPVINYSSEAYQKHKNTECLKVKRWKKICQILTIADIYIYMHIYILKSK